jgi:hypothetical protein
LCSLEKWSRLHVRAKVEDLRVTLKNIDRKDILEILNKRLNEEAQNLQKKLDPSQIKSKKKELELKRKFNALTHNGGHHRRGQNHHHRNNIDIEKKLMNPVSEEILKSREAELLHMNLTRFFEKLNNQHEKHKEVDESLTAKSTDQQKSKKFLLSERD